MTFPPAPPGPPPPGWADPYLHPYGVPPKRPTNGMAVAALVTSLVFAPLGIVFGHISLHQIKRSGEEGRGMAIAGLVIGYLLTTLAILGLILVMVLTLLVVQDAGRNPHYDRGPSYTAAPVPDPSIPPLPEFAPPAGLGAACSYPAADGAPARPAKPPREGRVPTQPSTVEVTIDTDRGAIGVTLDNAKAPCTVNSFVSLAQQGWFDRTTCHRLTANRSLSALQCGDPSGTGRGGPGYTFANEYPTNQYPKGSGALSDPVRYPRGTVAMANAGPDTNGSQFFILYADSMLPPVYTVFGSVDETGMATVDEVAEAGVTGGNLDGAPAQPVTVKSIRLQ
ncbi:peptidylprolyl isomerase [Mycobacterium sp. ACS4331]|uniref:peptidylprolyl isomerase n=1 Tax=Mycobacterium sp. ACS4331 TaxID=1834121 RepID=UPI0007FD64BB|nr:peptidylprolyl isomerase [Mycobacterium sp. ACS4331]OBF21930.1 cyclophilin [Mycobacterium sp. ACS4331]